MKYTIKTEAFEGPFDLLFHLIEKNKIDIYDIPISEIIDQYMYYIYEMESLNLEIASEFLVMAATLIEIKSKLLLPSEALKEKEIEMEDVDPRSQLVKKLLEYKKYKIVAIELKKKEKSYNKLHFKPKEELVLDVGQQDIALEGVGIQDLINAFKEILLTKSKYKKFRSSDNIQKISRESITIEDKANIIINILQSQKRVDFNKIFVDLNDKLDIVVSFLAILELVKIKKIKVWQDRYFDNIIIESVNLN